MMPAPVEHRIRRDVGVVERKLHRCWDRERRSSDGLRRQSGSTSAGADPPRDRLGRERALVGQARASVRDRLLVLGSEQIQRHAGPRRLVPSATRQGNNYRVDIAAGTCMCEDYKKRGQPCKHFWALHRALLGADNAEAPMAPPSAVAAPSSTPATNTAAPPASAPSAPPPPMPLGPLDLSTAWVDFSDET
jgi:hypothetical protein